jgi:hypothetical protein
MATWLKVGEGEAAVPTVAVAGKWSTAHAFITVGGGYPILKFSAEKRRVPGTRTVRVQYPGSATVPGYPVTGTRRSFPGE